MIRLWLIFILIVVYVFVLWLFLKMFYWFVVFDMWVVGLGYLIEMRYERMMREGEWGWFELVYDYLKWWCFVFVLRRIGLVVGNFLVKKKNFDGVDGVRIVFVELNKKFFNRKFGGGWKLVVVYEGVLWW